MGLLSNAGLNDHYEDKLTLSRVLEINGNTTSDEPLDTMQSLPGAFLKKLMLANIDARSVRCVTADEDAYILELDSYDSREPESTNANAINPLDLITALFLCSDSSLQQEMVRKMSMCQFAVPLLLPNCETKQSTLMLWALREVVKTFKPFTSTKSFVEECIVVSDIPLVSFVSLGKDSLCKYQILNRMLSNTFVHRDMDCDDAPRKISDGLVEISWYLPCGKTNIDMFDKPVAVANLRGDIRAFKKQFSFLCETSAAIYLFTDDYAGARHILKGKDTKTQIFLVMDGKKDAFRASVKGHPSFDNSTAIKMIIKKKQHDAEFVKIVLSSVNNVLSKNPNIVTIENMADAARRQGILVDEDSEACRTAQMNADEITTKITDTLTFKEEHLPLQGIWRELSQIDKERAGCQELSSLKAKEEKLKKKQQGFKMADAMERFIHAILDSSIEQTCFLQWMKMNLDDLSRQRLSGLREQYNDLCQNTPEKKDEITDLDQKICDCSLGLEHFLRELGQLYQLYSSGHPLSENSPQKKQIERLPQMYAQMLLDGLPIELVDGDAADIPLKWITDVLTSLHGLVKTNSKIRVVTVLGVQGTGKSTLLNAMFGVQFAVSTGRCTRGAFMQLIKVNRELRDNLKCDFIMIIDTEGLQAPELAQQNDSHEHDHELATLVVGLSDITVINMTMEVFAEMKGLLQIVVSTFLGMKQMIKKPRCHFVHQNVLHVSADANVRERKKLLEQLDEMTLEAAKMVNNGNITKFTDVMDYDPDTNSSYMPGLWHGIPPMAPVSVGYSEAVYDFKKRLMQDFKKCQQTDDLTHFLELLKKLRNTVKYQNPFRLRNSLSTAYKSWELTFNIKIESWLEKSEKQVSEDGKIREDLLREAIKVLESAEKEILGNLEKYLEKQDCSTSFVEKMREEFITITNKLRQDTESKMRDKLQKAFKSNAEDEVDTIKSSQAYMLERKVLDLLHHCSKTQSAFSHENLKQVFEKMWRKALLDCEINVQEVQRRDVAQEVAVMLRENVSSRHNINCLVDGETLEQCAKKRFVVESGGWREMAQGFMKHGHSAYHRKKLQESCDNIVNQCQDFITEMAEGESDYSNAVIQDLLKMIDKAMQQQKNVEFSEETEIALKKYIGGIASTAFQKMHNEFRAKNDPQMFLEEWKKNYFEDFLDKFHNRDQCQKKASDFVKLCLQPAVTDYVTKRTGPDIVGEMLIGAGSKDNIQGALQYTILQQLLHKLDYEKYKQYIQTHERFVKNWLLDQLEEKLSKDPCLNRFEKKHLTEVANMITTAISNISNTSNNDRDVRSFLHCLCNTLGEKLHFPEHALNSIMIVDIAYKDEFADYLTKNVRELEKCLSKECDRRVDIRKRLRNVLFKPPLLNHLLGCREQCPFCKAPCEAGEQDHDEHFSSVHRPQGLNGLKASKTLVTDTCSFPGMGTLPKKAAHRSSQASKHYHEHYLNWNLTTGSTTEATNYWKYVMVTFNERIAKDCGANPAKIPDSWKGLTRNDAFVSLKRTFNMK
ncbi:up-regulator of cell proliferation-like [Polymixia lowei]